MKLRRVLATGALFGVAAGMVSFGSAAHAEDAAAPDGVITATVESYAARVEYDIPLPAGPGTVAQVSGEIRASAAGENAKGVAASPTAIGPVVGGRYSDPDSDGHPDNRYPQTECFYPGSLVDTAFYFPTDEREETAPVPATSYATSQCAAGPLVDLHARSASGGGKGTAAAAVGPALTAGTFSSDALARPVTGTLEATTSSAAEHVSILDGALTVGSIVARGASHLTGKPGEASSSATIALDDIDAGGVTFSLNSATVDGNETVQLTVAGQTVPVDSSAAKAVIDAANTALKPTGCSLAPLTSPAQYPQGFLFSRPEPAIGVTDDGMLAASYRGGLVVTCNIPSALSEPTTFNPQRAQILLGFAYTGTALAPGDDNFSIGGFGTGDLVGVSQPASELSTQFDTLLAPAPAVETAALTAPEAQATPPALPVSAPAAILPKHLAAATKWLLLVLSLALWVPLTHYGARRLRLALDDGAGS